MLKILEVGQNVEIESVLRTKMLLEHTMEVLIFSLDGRYLFEIPDSVCIFCYVLYIIHMQ